MTTCGRQGGAVPARVVLALAVRRHVSDRGACVGSWQGVRRWCGECDQIHVYERDRAQLS